MDEKQKTAIIRSVLEMLPNAQEKRLKTLLSIILLEIQSYNACGKTIDWEKLEDIITEILFQSAKQEIEKEVASIKRGDMTISYASSQHVVAGLLAGYGDLISKLIGCSQGVEFF